MLKSEPDKPSFHEETDSFDLTVTLKANKLNIILKDYVGRAVYSKEYAEDDIGKEINKKMDLTDVFNAFEQTKVENDEENMRVKELYSLGLKKYEFGKIVEKENLPCYKIEKSGQITAYLNMMDMKVKKIVTYQSKLVLNQQRVLTEKEIKSQKIQPNKEIQNFKKEKQHLEQRITKLEKEKEKEIKEIKELKAENIQIRQKLKKMLTKIQSLQLKLDSTENKKIMSEKINKPKIYTNLPQAYSNRFKVNGKNVECIYGFDSGTQYIFNYPIQHNQSAQLKVKIISRSGWMVIGIVDYDQQKDQQNSRNSGNAICYSSDGYKYPLDIKQGTGFNPGQILEIAIDRSKNSIRYSVDGVLRAQQISKILADETKIFMPYVQMCQKIKSEVPVSSLKNIQSG